MTFNLNRDEVYTYTGETLEYYVTTGEYEVFRGVARRSPNESRISINLRKIASDWLEMVFDDFLPMDGETYHHEDAYRIFDLYRNDGVLLQEFRVFYGFGNSVEQNQLLSDPVDGKADPRQKLFATMFGDWTGTTSGSTIIIGGVTDFDAEEYVYISPSAGVAFVGFSTTHVLDEINATCSDSGVTIMRRSTNGFTFSVPVNSDVGLTKNYTINWYVNGVLADTSVIIVDATGIRFSCTPLVTLPSSGGTATIAIDTNVQNYQVVSAGLSVTSISNTGCTISVPANTSGIETVRYTIEFRYPSWSSPIVGTTIIEVLPDAPYFSCTEEFTTSCDGGDEIIFISTNYPMNDVTIGLPSGVTLVSVTQTGVTVNIPVNQTFVKRYFDVTFSYNGLTLGTTHITQDNFVAGDYFQLKAHDAGDFKVHSPSTETEVNRIYYRINGGRWTTAVIPPSGTTLVTSYASGDTVELYTTRLPMFRFLGTRFAVTGDVELAGNAMSLVWGTDFSGKTSFPTEAYDYETEDYSRYLLTQLFFHQTHVIDAKDLSLPATNLPEFAYYQMFYECSNLVHPPQVLPATTVPTSAYQRMFADCTSLVETADMAATNIGERGCCEMYLQCTSLVTVHDLSATNIGPAGYFEMFKNCSSLVTAPEISATTLSAPSTGAPYDGCMEEMFAYCTSLVNHPSRLPAMTVPELAYSDMFDHCTSLTSGPVLPATTFTGSHVYQRMFEGCTSLTTAPALPCLTLTAACYADMFSGCTSLVTAPDLLAEPANYRDLYACYGGMFSGCYALRSLRCYLSVPEGDAGYCTSGWLEPIYSGRGTFYYKRGAYWAYNSGGVPSGWDREREG